MHFRLLLIDKISNEISCLVKKVEQNVTNKPASVCASYMYVYCMKNNVKLSLNEICNICGVLITNNCSAICKTTSEKLVK